MTVYAAFNFHALIAQPAAFGLMVTVLAAWLADSQRSQGLALMAVGGGFATPFMLPSDRPIRYLAMVVFGVTTAKVFLIDLAELDRIYRVLSIIGLGVLLLATSYLYQRYSSRLTNVGPRPTPWLGRSRDP